MRGRVEGRGNRVGGAQADLGHQSDMHNQVHSPCVHTLSVRGGGGLLQLVICAHVVIPDSLPTT
jgi:hypothetical protein